MKNDFLTAILQITDEKKLPKDVVIHAIESALTATYKRNLGSAPEVRVRLNENTGEFRIFADKRVVIDVDDPETGSIAQGSAGAAEAGHGWRYRRGGN